MKYVAVIKTLADIDPRPEDQTYLPAEYPVEMREFEASSLEDAQQLHPDKEVMLASTYRDTYSTQLNDLYEQAQVAQEVLNWELW